MRFAFLTLISLVSMMSNITDASAQMRQRSERQRIDCAISRLSVPGQYDCRIWSVDYTANHRPRVWFEDSLPGAGCTREIGSVQVNAAQYVGYVRYVMPSPGAHFDCVVSGWQSIDRNRMRSISEETEAAIDMGFPQSSGDRFVSAFTSDEGLACRAFVLLGPVAQTRRHHGDFRQYRIQGHLCPKTGAVLNDLEFEAFLGSMQLRRG
jgi:hypothetical protein